MCIAGLEDDKARAYTAMYDITFVNEQGWRNIFPACSERKQSFLPCEVDLQQAALG